jgi:hypothetical protein
MTIDDRDNLELMVDKFSLVQILDALVEIAIEKSSHIRYDRQDNYSARTWTSASECLFEAQKSVETLRL